MEKDQYFTFRKFTDKGLATLLVDLLKKNNIDFIVDGALTFDPITAFSDSEAGREFSIKLKKENFEKANELLMQSAKEQLEFVDKDYYLFGFTDDELMEIISKPDEWGMFDYLLAQQILKDRGREMNPDIAGDLRKHRMEELARPDKSGRGWIFAGYIFALIGGLLGVFIGWHLMTHKKTLPDGERVYGYSVTDRKHGQRILVLGLFFILAWFAVVIFTPFGFGDY